MNAGLEFGREICPGLYHPEVFGERLDFDALRRSEGKPVIVYYPWMAEDPEDAAMGIVMLVEEVTDDAVWLNDKCGDIKKLRREDVEPDPKYAFTAVWAVKESEENHDRYDNEAAACTGRADDTGVFGGV